MPRGVCHLCGDAATLVASHVFPEFFDEGTYDESHQFVSLSTHPRHKPRTMQRGLTEPLLCAPCDGQLGQYESYAASLLRRVDAAGENVPGGTALDRVDFTSFRLFGLSLLWRAHIARAHMFATVDLGPHADRLRAMLRAGAPGEAHEYGFALAKETGLATRGDLMIGPARSRYRGHRAYHFMARGYTWAYVVSGATAGLRGHFPFAGMTPTLYIPLVQHDQRTLFSQIRRAFSRPSTNPKAK